MLIVCPNCGTSYQVTPESLGETGRSVRCVGCHQIWFEEARSPVPQPAFAADPDPMTAPLIRPPLDDVVDMGALGEEAAVPVLAEIADAAPDIPQHEGIPSIVPATGSGLPHIEATKNIERAAASPGGRRAPMRRKLLPSRYVFPVALGALVLAVFCIVAARQQVVRFLPQTASLYAWIGLPVNLRGLAFERIKTARVLEDGVPMLTVEGEIVGTTGRHTEVPRLRFAVTDGNGKEIYAWTARPSRTLLPPGETLPFRSRLASPPAEASSISVRFFNRRDAQAGFM